MPQTVPQCLLQLLEDYTLQALDAAQDVSDEFEAEVVDLASRARRIHSVLHLIRDVENKPHTSSPPPPPAAPRRGSSQAYTQFALQALGKMTAGLTGVPAVGTGTLSSSFFSGDVHSFGLQPVGRPVSFAESALELYAHNTRVVFRRVEKRGRDDSDNGGGDGNRRETPKRSIFSRLAAEQRRRRFALYTARVALFPRAIPLPSTSGKRGEETFPPFVSPAVREFAELNVEAECGMLKAFYHVDSKAQLLRELPTLRSSVHQLQESLSAAGVVIDGYADGTVEKNKKTREGESRERLAWFEFPSFSEGVIRIVVRQSLVLDITWDSVRGGQWRVLYLHWILRAQTVPEIVQIQKSSEHACGIEVLSKTPSFSSHKEGTLCVHPAHFEATLRYLSSCFELGLESGCMGALRVVNAVAMEVIETQCKSLREKFFVGPLESSFMLDVRPGTHVALSLTLPPTTRLPQGGVLHVKYKLSMGTIVVERRRGTDTQMMQQSDLYWDASVGLEPRSAVVVDVERLLWEFVSGESS